MFTKAIAPFLFLLIFVYHSWHKNEGNLASLQAASHFLFTWYFVFGCLLLALVMVFIFAPSWLAFLVHKAYELKTQKDLDIIGVHDLNVLYLGGWAAGIALSRPVIGRILLVFGSWLMSQAITMHSGQYTLSPEWFYGGVVTVIVGWLWTKN